MHIILKRCILKNVAYQIQFIIVVGPQSMSQPTNLKCNSSYVPTQLAIAHRCYKLVLTDLTQDRYYWAEDSVTSRVRSLVSRCLSSTRTKYGGAHRTGRLLALMDKLLRTHEISTRRDDGDTELIVKCAIESSIGELR